MHEVYVKSIVSPNKTMNLYRGCSHGCIYCDSRSTCYNMDHKFEDIEVKVNSLELLEDYLKKKRKPSMLMTGAMTDPYIHLEEELNYTRGALELIYKYGFGLSILTKSTRILRDLDLLKMINEKTKVVVQMTITSYDEDLCRIIEPNVSTSRERFEALKIFRDNGIATIIWMTPILPYINDTEENILAILNYGKEAGVRGILSFGMGMTLRNGNREYFYKKLDENFKGLKDRYIKEYGNSYEIKSPNEENLYKILKKFCQENDIMYKYKDIFAFNNEMDFNNKFKQLNIFDDIL